MHPLKLFAVFYSFRDQNLQRHDLSLVFLFDIKGIYGLWQGSELASGSSKELECLVTVVELGLISDDFAQI